jgi:hypothetical protein
MILSVFCSAAWSQEPPKQEPPKQDIIKLMRSDFSKLQMRQQMKMYNRAAWDGTSDGNVLIIGQLQYPNIRKGLGISDEQFAELQKIQEQSNNLVQKIPEYESLQAELRKLGTQQADETSPQKIGEIRTRMAQLMMNVRRQEIEKLLTPEQKQKIQEFQLATMSVMPVISAKMFDVLGLSDEQKNQMAAVKKELDPQFDQCMDEFSDSIFLIRDKIYDKLERENTSITDHKEFREKFQAASEELKIDDDFQKFRREVLEKAQGFATLAKFKMFDVLTDEQMAKLQNLIDNPPDYVKEYLAEAKKMYDANSSAPQSFMNAWKPGDPVPAEYKEKRKLKPFPKTE